MPLQNRVAPTGELLATPARGTLMGNRGLLHDDRQRIVRPFAVRRWIICTLRYKTVHRRVMTPGLYTELFFLDEATGLAAGHRPCAFCQRTRFNQFCEAWVTGNPGHVSDAKQLRVDVLDGVLHRERIDAAKRKVTFAAKLSTLPAGTMVLLGDVPRLVTADALRPWTPFGYGEPVLKPKGTVRVLTPRSVVNAIRAGFGVSPATA